MKASQLIGRIADRLKNSAHPGSAFCRSPKALVEDACAPLLERLQSTPRAPPKLFLSAGAPSSAPPLDPSSEDFHIFQLIVEYLCRAGATESARTLLQDFEECVPVRKEDQTTQAYKLYNPWAEVFSQSPTKPVTRPSSALKEWDAVKALSAETIEAAEKADRLPSLFGALYGPITAYHALHREVLSVSCVEDEIDKILQLARNSAFIEHGSLFYFSGTSSVSLSLHSQEYRRVLSLLSLLVSSLRLPDVQREHKKIEKSSVSFSKKVPLDILYFIGKKMEEINAYPYDKNTDLLESAAPSAFSFHSSFFCPVLRSECSIDNPPSLLPCGHVISTRAVERIVSLRGVFFRCPYCPKEVNIREIIRLKILI